MSAGKSNPILIIEKKLDYFHAFNSDWSFPYVFNADNGDLHTCNSDSGNVYTCLILMVLISTHV